MEDRSRRAGPSFKRFSRLSAVKEKAVKDAGLLDLGTVRLVVGKSRSLPYLAFRLLTVAVEVFNATLSALDGAYPHGESREVIADRVFV
jgi:hypothetical protein